MGGMTGSGAGASLIPLRSQVRPPVPYFGGKMRVADQIVARLPPHQHYVEPFCGSLAVLLAKPPVALETVNDLDGDLMTFWRVLRDQPAELERACALTPHSRTEYRAAFDLPGELTDLERARRVWVQLTQSRTGTRAGTGWRYYQNPRAKDYSMPKYLAGYVSRMAPVVDRLRGVSLESRPALDVIHDYGRHEDVLLYVDPPYLGSTRSANYAVEMTGDEQHRELADALMGCAAAVVLSGYASELYDDLYAGWERAEFAATTEHSGASDSRTEVLWSNRRLSEPDLFDLLGEPA
jgi:DNA adenine methylase